MKNYLPLLIPLVASTISIVVFAVGTAIAKRAEHKSDISMYKLAKWYFFGAYVLCLIVSIIAFGIALAKW